ncbi:MAG: DUF1553 domain-containing protein [Planctomycetaceae bacterium]
MGCGRGKFLIGVFLWLLLGSGAGRAFADDMLVLMHGTGRVERYDLESGAHVGTVLSGLPPGNSLLLDPDGRLLISTGNPGEMGTVLRYNPRDGGSVETLINVPEGYGGRLHRATGMVWHDGDLLVASQNDGKVKRYSYPSGEWQEDVALATPGGITQIALHGGRLYVTDHAKQAILRCPEKLDGTLSEVWAHSPTQAPWGLAFNAQGDAFWSTNANRILRTRGTETVEWAGAGGHLATPMSLTIGPDGLLYCTSWQGPVSVWKTDAPNPGEPVKLFNGPEVKGPVSLLFTTQPRTPEFAYTPVGLSDETPEKVAFFESKIRPLLHARCIECHNEQTQEGGLRLDLRSGWEAGGDSGRAIQPGKPEESTVYQAVVYLDKDLKMPPDAQLPAEEIALLRQWIEQGAIDPRRGEVAPTKPASDAWAEVFQQRLDWWNLKPLATSPPPEVADPAWAQSPVDRFIRAELDQQNLTPATPAAAEDLLRRLSYVLTGLPPSVAQREKFLAAQRVDPNAAYAELVEDLLASPHYGEAMARHWMDAVRYTDTYGYEWDNPAKGSHEYRDYLIRAFNHDVGFDTLLREQLAGDLLPQPRLNETLGINESIIGPMFYHMGEHRHGSSLQFNGIHQEMVNNKVDAFSKVFLATTVACARCHDHKLEPVSQKDYYALGAMFITPRWGSRPADALQKNAAAIAKLKELRTAIRNELAKAWRGVEIKSTAWQMPLQKPEPKEPELGDVDYPLVRLAKAGAEIEATWNALTTEWQTHRHARIDSNKAYTVLADFSQPTLPPGWVMEGDGIESGWVDDGTPLIALEGDAVVARLLPRGIHTHALSSKLPGVLRMPPQHTVPGSKVSLKLAGGEYGGSLILDENAIQNESVAFLKQSEPSWRTYDDLPLKNGVTRVTIDFATSSLNSNFPPRTGLAGGLPNDDFGFDKRSWLSITGIATHDAGGAPLDLLDRFTTLFKGAAPKTAEEANSRIESWLKGAVTRWCDGQSQPGDQSIVDWLVSRKLLPNQATPGSPLASLVEEYRRVEQSIEFPRTVNSMDERAAVKTGLFFNVRGNVDAMGDVIMPASLSMFGPNDAITSSPGSGRLELAESLLNPEHPLTTRVYVNRVWQWIFGTGIVATPDDFGRLGDRPSHPELLDWLARDFMRQGWSTKALVRQLVLSQTFRESGLVASEASQRDPYNRLRHHYPTRRLEAEQVRDALLAVSGRLDPTLYGRPILPPRTVEDGSKRLFSGPVDGNGRRSLYLMMSIMAPPKFLTAFDLPDLKLPSGRRNVTSVPAQALLLLNDPLIDQLSHQWANQLMKIPHSLPGDRIEAMFVTALGRQPSDSERERWTALLRELSTSPDPMADETAWAHLAHTLFNTKEFLYYR